MKMLHFAKHITWINHAGNTFCHLRACHNRCKYLIQSVNYSTRYSSDVADLPVDPRVEALRDKLLYCDYLDLYKLKVDHQKRFKLKKNAEYREEKEKFEFLTNVPAYSVLLDTKDENDEDHLSEENRITQEDVTKIVHMPYASTDQYDIVDVFPNESKNEKASAKVLHKDTLPLNEKYKALYDKYLAAKEAALHTDQNVTLEDYVPETGESYKTDFSRVPHNWMVDVEEYDDTLEKEEWLDNYGTPDPNCSISSVPCGGCGALLHCKDRALPGYLPSELFQGKTEQKLQKMVCQRCHFLQYYKTALEVKVSPDEYISILKVIKKSKCAVILMVDLTDFPCSIWPEISTMLNRNTPVFVVGNKIDLLPRDSSKFFMHVKECLSKAVENTGIDRERIKDVALVSAKTGYGIEKLINKLHNVWKYKGDVYLIGCTNVGKSSLFNALLQSDYCKVQAVDLIQRATISPWPGTTLNVLKFPILNPLRWRLYHRLQRLKEERIMKQIEEQSRISQFRETRQLKYATLQDRIGTTFYSKSRMLVRGDLVSENKYRRNSENFGFDEHQEEYKNSRWCYDTPGTIQPDQTLDLLTTHELLTVLPNEIISPRTFILYADQTIFLGGMGRLDYLEGDDYIRCTIFASKKMPVTVTRTKDADEVYDELLKTEAFVVPENNPNRLKHWPAMGSKEMEVTCIGKKESVADVVLSNAGWIAITGTEAERVLLKAWTPQGRGLYLRTPALLKRSVVLRGSRVQDIPTYKKGRQMYRR